MNFFKKVIKGFGVFLVVWFCATIAQMTLKGFGLLEGSPMETSVYYGLIGLGTLFVFKQIFSSKKPPAHYRLGGDLRYTNKTEVGLPTKNYNPDEASLSTNSKNISSQDQSASSDSGTVSSAEKFLASTSTPSVRTKDISQFMMLVKEWARISDFNLAVMLDDSNQRLTDEIIDHLKISANRGKSQACYLVGEIYRLGMDGGLSRPVQARLWFEKAEKIGHLDAEDALKKLDMQEGEIEEVSKNVDAKNDPEFATSNSTEGDESWSEEFQILNEYDPVVKECHEELGELDPQLSSQFRDEVVSNRKKATDIRDRLKAQHENKLNPYTSDELNEALAEARLLGPSAGEEFTRVVEVMGEDLDVEAVLNRLKKKMGATPPRE